MDEIWQISWKKQISKCKIFKTFITFILWNKSMIPWLQVAPDWVYDHVQYRASKFNNSDRRAILRF